jgi:hypothetical protein
MIARNQHPPYGSMAYEFAVAMGYIPPYGPEGGLPADDLDLGLTGEMVDAAETAATEERRRIGRRTGRRSTILTSGLEWPPAVHRKTLLGV